MPICFTQPIRNVRDCLYMALPPRRCWSLHPQGLSLGTFNTRNGRGFRLAYEIRAVQISSFDLMIMTETKITDQAYLCNMMVYDVMFLEDITMKGGGVQGGVVLVIWEQTRGWSIELTRFHGPNMVICKAVADGKRTLLIGA